MLGLLIITWLGLALTLAGVTCAGVAFVRTWRDHEQGPIFPALARTITAIRRTLRRLAWWRKREPVVAQGSATLAAAAAMTADGVVTGPAIPPDVAVDEAIRLLVRRIERIEQEAADARKQHKEAIRTLRGELSNVATGLRHADEELRALSKAIATSSVKLQLWSLMLIGSGTVLLTIPTLAALMAGL